MYAVLWLCVFTMTVPHYYSLFAIFNCVHKFCSFFWIQSSLLFLYACFLHVGFVWNVTGDACIEMCMRCNDRELKLICSRFYGSMATFKSSIADWFLLIAWWFSWLLLLYKEPNGHTWRHLLMLRRDDCFSKGNALSCQWQASEWRKIDKLFKNHPLVDPNPPKFQLLLLGALFALFILASILGGKWGERI